MRGLLCQGLRTGVTEPVRLVLVQAPVHLIGYHPGEGGGPFLIAAASDIEGRAGANVCDGAKLPD